MVVKPVDGAGGYGIVIGPQADDETLTELARAVRADPRGYVAQDPIALSTAPTFVGGAMAPRHLDLRPFAVHDGDDVWVVPGGLTRVALREGSLVVNSSQGGGSKDTWVLAGAMEAPEPPAEEDAELDPIGHGRSWRSDGRHRAAGVGPVARRGRPVSRSRAEPTVLSRIAESLYWIGRSTERAEDTARLLDVHYHHLLEDRFADETVICKALLRAMGTDVPDVRDADAVMRQLAFAPTNPGSIVASLEVAWENARGAREAISSEMWEVLNTAHFTLANRAATAIPHEFFRQVRDRMSVLAGLADATLARDEGWRFLVLGRNIERIDMSARILTAARRERARRGLGHHAAVRVGVRGVPADVPARGRRVVGGRVPAPRPPVPAVGHARARHVRAGARGARARRRPGAGGRRGASARGDRAGGARVPARRRPRRGPPGPARGGPARGRGDPRRDRGPLLPRPASGGVERLMDTLRPAMRPPSGTGPVRPAPEEHEDSGGVERLSERRAWRLEIRHTTGYRYATDVTASHNEVRLSPIRTDRQWVLEHRVDVHPAARLARFEDYWGTVVHAFDLRRPHRELTVVATSHVETAAAPPPPTDSVSWRELEDEEWLDEWCELLMPTPYTEADGAIAALGEQVRRAPDPAAAVVEAEGLVRDRLEYVRGATDVRTTAAEALGAGAGVCQDFVHLTLAVLRSAGVPCRYASGYLVAGRRGGDRRDGGGGEPRVARGVDRWLDRGRPDQRASRRSRARARRPRARLRRRAAAARRVPRRPGRGARRAGRGHPPRVSRRSTAIRVRGRRRGAGRPRPRRSRAGVWSGSRRP